MDTDSHNLLQYSLRTQKRGFDNFLWKNLLYYGLLFFVLQLLFIKGEGGFWATLFSQKGLWIVVVSILFGTSVSVLMWNINKRTIRKLEELIREKG